MHLPLDEPENKDITEEQEVKLEEAEKDEQEGKDDDTLDSTKEKPEEDTDAEEDDYTEEKVREDEGQDKTKVSITANFILVGTFSLHDHDVKVFERDVSMVIATFLIGWFSLPTFEKLEVRWVATTFDSR